MKARSRKRFLMMLLIGALVALMVPQGAMAWTAACTNINNKATVNFQVGGVDQAPIESSMTGNSTPGVGNGENTTFKVGNRVNLSVAKTDVAEVSVNPGAADKLLTFTVTNDGNLVQDYSLTAIANSTGTANPFGGGLTDTFDATGVGVYVESGATGGYQSGEDTATRIDELAVGANKTVYIVADIPLAQANNDLSVYTLVATTRDGGGVGSEGDVTAIGDSNACGGTAATVFSDGTGTDDGANDGKDSDRNAYKVSAVVLNVQKTSTVISDPINGTSSPKAIPLAIVEYTITATYGAGGSGSATSLSISDAVPANTVAKINVYGTDGDVRRITSTDGGTTPVTTDLEDGVDADLVDWDTPAASAIEANCGITLDQTGDYCTIKFRVEIQ